MSFMEACIGRVIHTYSYIILICTHTRTLFLFIRKNDMHLCYTFVCAFIYTYAHACYPSLIKNTINMHDICMHTMTHTLHKYACNDCISMHTYATSLYSKAPYNPKDTLLSSPSRGGGSLYKKKLLKKTVKTSKLAHNTVMRSPFY